MSEGHQEPPKHATEREKEHMRRIGQYVAEANEERLRLHLALPMRERLAASLALSQRFRSDAAIQEHLQHDDPSPLYDRARKLGLVWR